MAKVNMGKVEDAQDFTPIPDGEYLARVAEVDDTKPTQANDEMWRIRYEILEGEYAGRYIFDNLVFSAKALKRVKLVFSRLGLDVTQDQEAEWLPAMIQDKQVKITVITEEYEAEGGTKKKRNSIPYAGFERVEGGVSPDGSQAGEAVPF